MQMSEEDRRKEVIESAKREKSRLRAMLELIKGDDDCEAVLSIEGVDHAFSSSGIFTEIIKNEIEEINKAIRGEKNKWE